MKKVTCCILSYNLPEATDRLYNNFKEKVKKTNCELIVFDNGSDPDKISKYTTHRINKNLKMTGGLNECLKICKKNNSYYVWLMVNDILIKTEEPIENMIEIIENNSNIGIVHPALTQDTVTAYDFLKYNPNEQIRFKESHMVDTICPFYTKEALDAFNWCFNPELKYGWGIDYESCYAVRKKGMKVVIDYKTQIYHFLSELYKNKRDKEFKNEMEFYQKANMNFHTYFIKKYGPNWKEKFEKLL